MKVKAIIDKFDSLPDEMKKYFQEDSMGIVLGKEYDVYAISNWRGLFFFQIVNETKEPDWMPANVFTISNKKMPNDWLCNIFDDNELRMVIGPEFVSKDIDSYNDMVQFDPQSIKLFWERVKNIE